MTLQEIIADIHGINVELIRFEKKYELLSDVFYEWYCSGEEPEDDSWVLDFSLWAGLYETKLERDFTALTHSLLTSHARHWSCTPSGQRRL